MSERKVELIRYTSFLGNVIEHALEDVNTGEEIMRAKRASTLIKRAKKNGWEVVEPQWDKD